MSARSNSVAGYEGDFHGWAVEQAALLRAGRETGMLPWTCPHRVDQIGDEAFWPEEG